MLNGFNTLLLVGILMKIKISLINYFFSFVLLSISSSHVFSSNEDIKFQNVRIWYLSPKEIIVSVGTGVLDAGIGALDLLKNSDIVSLHVDGKKSNTNLISDKEFRIMKEKSILVNYSRGNVVDIDSLIKNIKSKKLMGAALDVFPEEPSNNKEKFKSKVKGIEEIILSPHIGGSTKEAQKNIGSYVPDKIIDFINSGNTSSSVNFPKLSLPEQSDSHRLIQIHKNEPGVMLEINKIISEYNINIKGQYLKTNEEIGYVITDIDSVYNKEVVKSLKNIPVTLKLRVLY